MAVPDIEYSCQGDTKMKKIKLPQFDKNLIPKELIKPLGIVVVIIIIASALSRTLGRSETLEEYARKHPEQQIKQQMDEQVDE